MEELKFFVCGVCQTVYRQREHAEQCERRGLEEVKVEVHKEYKMRVPALTSPFFIGLRQRSTIVQMQVKVQRVEGPFSHESHRANYREIRLKGEPIFCRHFDPPHLEGQHVYYIQYQVLRVNKADAVLPSATLLNSWGEGDCSQEHFLQYVNVN